MMVIPARPLALLVFVLRRLLKRPLTKIRIPSTAKKCLGRYSKKTSILFLNNLKKLTGTGEFSLAFSSFLLVSSYTDK